MRLDEVGVLQGQLLESAGDIQQRILDAELAQDRVAGLLEDLGARIVVLVDAMAEADEPEAAGLVLGHGDALLGRRPALVDLLEHLDDRHVGPAVQRPPEGADARGAGGEQVGLAGADHAHRRRAAVLLVVGVQDEDQVQGVLDLGVDLILLVGHREHHVQEIRAVAQRRVGIDERQAPGAAVGVGGDGADLADDSSRGILERGWIVQVKYSGWKQDMALIMAENGPWAAPRSESPRNDASCSRRDWRWLYRRSGNVPVPSRSAARRR